MLSRMESKGKNKGGQHRSGPPLRTANKPQCYHLKHYATILMCTLEMRKTRLREANLPNNLPMSTNRSV